MHVAVAVGAALAVNAIVFGLGFRASGPDRGPPGWLVGVVWVVLFAMLGEAYIWLHRARVPGGGWIVAFGLLCLAYPFYTGGLVDEGAGLAGNLVTGAAAIALTLHLAPRSMAAAVLVAPVIPWLAYATWTIVRPD